MPGCAWETVACFSLGLFIVRLCVYVGGFFFFFFFPFYFAGFNVLGFLFLLLP